MRLTKPRVAAAVALLALAAGDAAAQTFPSAPYFPLATNNSWTYQRDGVPGYVRTVTGNGPIAGTKEVFFTPDTEYEYYSNDTQGIRGHRGRDPTVDGAGCGAGGTQDFSPPFRYAAPNAFVGQSIGDSGAVAATLGSTGSPFCVFSGSYSTQSQIVGFETITVPLGTFRVLRVDHGRSTAIPSLGISTSESYSYWVAEHVGIIKSTELDNGVPHTYLLTATNIARTAPDTFSFAAQTGVAPGSVATSGTITVTGTTVAAPISITGGEYRIDNGAFTGASGTVSNGSTVTVRQTASSAGNMTTSAVLTIGGVNATFSVTTGVSPTAQLTVNVSGGGAVTSSPAGINCSASCPASFNLATPVTLMATPAQFYQFSGWSGACTGSGECSVTMNAAASVTATFSLIPDTQAPAVPAALTATAVSATQVNIAWSAASDDRAVTQYRIFRNGVQVGVTGGSATSYTDGGLAAATLYSYAVAACDAAGNCSAQSGAAAATTLAAGQVAYTPQLEAGFNLAGNVLGAQLSVLSLFGNQDAPVPGVTENVLSVWKWNAAGGRWAFFSPQLTGPGNSAYAASRSFETLSTVDPGEGYWVNAVSPMTLPMQSGAGSGWTSASFAALPAGFNLIAHADARTPSEFNAAVNPTPPGAGEVPTGNFVSLWAWDAVQGKWYFHSPILESAGGLPAVKAHADSHNFLHFQDYGRLLGIGTGFWVNRP